MKKIFAAILAIALLCSISPQICMAIESDLISNTVVPIADADVITRNAMGISQGVAYITLFCDPNDASVNFIQATSYIEKYVNSQWVTMTLENGGTQWTNVVGSNTMNLPVEQKITMGTGQYRITTTFAIYYIGVGNKYKTATYTATYS